MVRELIALGPLPQAGEPVRIDRDAFPVDPWLGHGIWFREVGEPAALGTFPAWLTSGESDTWAILVHGKGAERTECLRILPMFVERGHSTLTITYRNDEGAPASLSGYYQFGADEWNNLEAAAEYAGAAGDSAEMPAMTGRRGEQEANGHSFTGGEVRRYRSIRR